MKANHPSNQVDSEAQHGITEDRSRDGSHDALHDAGNADGAHDAGNADGAHDAAHNAAHDAGNTENSMNAANQSGDHAANPSDSFESSQPHIESGNKANGESMEVEDHKRSAESSKAGEPEKELEDKHSEGGHLRKQTYLEKMISSSQCKPTPRHERDYSLVIWGATGFTGRLACEHMMEVNLKLARAGEPLISWAPAGRNRTALEILSADLRMKYNAMYKEVEQKRDQGSSDGKLKRSYSQSSGELLGTRYIYVSEPDNINEMRALSSRTACIAAFAGPFELCGELVVRACVDTETDYVDATAELNWVRRMKDTYDSPAKAKGLKIVPCCGFDFVPNDLMMVQLSSYLNRSEKLASTPATVLHAFKQSTTSVSGGTAKSGLIMLSLTPLKDIVRQYVSPYTLIPDVKIAPQVRNANEFWILPKKIPQTGGYVTPFVMSNLMSKYIHWSNKENDMKWGSDLIYHGGERRENYLVAVFAALILWLEFFGAVLLSRCQPLWKFLPRSGEGPAIGDNAFMESDLVASVRNKNPEVGGTRTVRINWRFEGAEAYKTAAIFVVQSGLCLALDRDHCGDGLGVTTPSNAIGEHLVERLRHVGLKTTETEGPSA